VLLARLETLVRLGQKVTLVRLVPKVTPVRLGQKVTQAQQVQMGLAEERVLLSRQDLIVLQQNAHTRLAILDLVAESLFLSTTTMTRA
jgi:hypothetical protein